MPKALIFTWYIIGDHHEDSALCYIIFKHANDTVCKSLTQIVYQATNEYAFTPKCPLTPAKGGLPKKSWNHAEGVEHTCRTMQPDYLIIYLFISLII